MQHPVVRIRIKERAEIYKTYIRVISAICSEKYRLTPKEIDLMFWVFIADTNIFYKDHIEKVKKELAISTPVLYHHRKNLSNKGWITNKGTNTEQFNKIRNIIREDLSKATSNFEMVIPLTLHYTKDNENK